MSHELRTPLNSSLILAKLLADNKDGNLTAEQVKFAQTISSAGNDLLTLINDILDLSKIEAGKVEIASESVRIDRAIAGAGEERSAARRTERHSGSRAIVEPGTPEQIRDRSASGSGRFCKNLLSNAIKFTDRGEVSLRVSSPGDGRRRLRGARHRHRHPRRTAVDHFRGLPAGRRQHASQVRRHRTGAVDLARSGAPARRRHHGRRAAPARAACSR